MLEVKITIGRRAVCGRKVEKQELDLKGGPKIAA
jgi:hypothetical protein